MEKEIVNEIIDFLNNRKGFDDWWGDIDDDIKNEIKQELENIVKSKQIKVLNNLDDKIKSWDDGGCSTGLNED
jgi:hypothetical protein